MAVIELGHDTIISDMHIPTVQKMVLSFWTRFRWQLMDYMVQ